MFLTFNSICTAAVALEKKNQRATFRKQRDDYKRRATALKRELKILKGQREELVSGSQPPSPTTNGFLKENDRLQVNMNWPNPQVCETYLHAAHSFSFPYRIPTFFVSFRYNFRNRFHPYRRWNRTIFIFEVEKISKNKVSNPIQA